MYWDEIEVPCNEVIDWALPRTTEVVELMDAGVLKETIVYVASNQRPVPPAVPTLQLSSGHEEMSAFLVRTQWALFDHNERKDRGSWTIAQNAGELVVAVPESEPASTAEVELHDLLPVPGEAVPIAAILEFKEKRRPELTRLRSELDLLSLNVANGQRLPKAKEAAIEQVRDAVSDVFRVMNEKFETKLARRFGMSISLGTLVTIGAAAMHVALPLAVGAAASMIGLKIRESRAPKNLVRTGPFAYLHDVMKDLT